MAAPGPAARGLGGPGRGGLRGPGRPRPRTAGPTVGRAEPGDGRHRRRRHLRHGDVLRGGDARAGRCPAASQTARLGAHGRRRRGRLGRARAGASLDGRRDQPRRPRSAPVGPDGLHGPIRAGHPAGGAARVRGARVGVVRRRPVPHRADGADVTLVGPRGGGPLRARRLHARPRVPARVRLERHRVRAQRPGRSHGAARPRRAAAAGPARRRCRPRTSPGCATCSPATAAGTRWATSRCARDKTAVFSPRRQGRRGLPGRARGHARLRRPDRRRRRRGRRRSTPGSTTATARLDARRPRRVGPRDVVYRRRGLDAWSSATRRCSTSPTFTLEGRPMRGVRQAVNRVQPRGLHRTTCGGSATSAAELRRGVRAADALRERTSSAGSRWPCPGSATRDDPDARRRRATTPRAAARRPRTSSPGAPTGCRWT